MAVPQESTAAAGVAVDYAAVKERQRLGWQTGDYPRVGVMLQLMAELLVEAADELVRVTRPGGHIGLASWEPQGMGGDLFKIVANYAPPPPGVRPVALWGSREHLAQLFGDRVDWISLTSRDHVWRFPSSEHFSAFFREHYGPITRAAAGLDEARRQELAGDLTRLAERFNTETGGTLVAPQRYLEAVGTRR
jgi:hypothetical protein